MSDDSSDEAKHNWEFFRDKPPEAFIHYYGSIENVPEEHKEEARKRVLNMNDRDAIDFISIGDTRPWRFSEDVIDAIAIGTLEGLGDHIIQDGEEILELLPESNKLPIDIPPGKLGYNLFQIHVVTISYVESAGEILYRHFRRDRNRMDVTSLLEWASHENRVGESLMGMGDIDDKLDEVIEWALEKVSRILRVLLHSDIIDQNTYQNLDNIRKRRNSLIHSAASLAVNDFGDKRDVRTAVEECVRSVSVIGEELESVERHPIYDELTTG